MNIRRFFTTLPILALLCACQTEAPKENIETKHVFTVRATLPGSDDTRAHITYGNTDISKELFKWDMDDEIFVFNASKISECPYGITMASSYVKDNYAEFEISQDDPSFRIEAGDVLFIAYYNARTNPFHNSHIFTYDVGTQANIPQYIMSDPNDRMSYIKKNLRMYDIVTAVKDDSIPDLHFRHLSAIMRVTLYNETGDDLYLTDIEFKYPTKSPTAIEGDIVDRNPSFFATTLYCSVETIENNKHYLKVYDTNELYNGSKPYTENIGTTINGKNGTLDAGESIPNGESYELYLSTVPRIGNDSSGKKLTINLIETHHTQTPYSITIDNFNTVIEAGKRYWFKLVATPDHKLVFKSKYNPDDYKTNGSSEEENKEESGEENGGEMTPEN